MLELRPFRVFRMGEIIAFSSLDNNNNNNLSDNLRYGIVMTVDSSSSVGNSLRRISIKINNLGETKGGEGVNEYIILHDVINGYYLNLIYFQRGKKLYYIIQQF